MKPGNLYAWGDNSKYQLGDGTSTNRSKPVQVSKPANAPNNFVYTQAIAGYYHSLAFGSDGVLYSWGYNGYGRLGDGTSTSRSPPGAVNLPAGVPDGFTYTQASAGSQHSLAVGSDGNLYGWGLNSNGELGNGTTIFSSSQPIQVRKPASSADTFTYTQASAGYYHSQALGSDGNLYSWGDNSSGQLGNGTTSNQVTPTLVSKPTATSDTFTWLTTSSSCNHTLATGNDGTTYAWGANSSSQLGNRTSKNQPTPAPVLFPERGTPISVRFGGIVGTNLSNQLNDLGLSRQADGTWAVSTPAHDWGEVDVSITWALNGILQKDDNTNIYTYDYIKIGKLPQAGGRGILLLLLSGLILMASTLIVKQYAKRSKSRHIGHTPRA